MGLQFDVNNNVEDFTFVLSTRGYDYYGEIRNVKRDSVVCKKNMNAADELSFEVYKTVDGIDERLWDEIKDFKLVWVKELNEYFEIYVNLDDSITPMKTITATSLCEAELGQVMLYEIEINTEDDIARDNYVVTKFYDQDNQKGSLLHRILDKAPHYSIKHVDSSLMNLQRSFSIDGTSIYDWLIGECSEQFNCLFIFDSTDRSISAYDLYTVCRDCGYRGEYDDICPECGSTDLKYYGEDTTIYVDKENLTDSVKLETDTGSVKNCFKLEAGDDDMTTAVININPNGTGYIYYISDEQKADMPDELVEKINNYDKLVESYTEEYEQLAEDMYQVIDNILYYKSGMMPTIEHAEVTASTEAAKLTEVNLSPVAITSVTESTSKTTVESALKNYAKVYVKTGYVKLEINKSEFTYIGKGADGWNHGTWTGNFKVTNYSDEEDVAYSEIISVDVSDNYEEFLQQKILKSIADDNDEEGTVFDVLSIEKLDDFKEALSLYCLNRLTSFADAIQGALDVLVQVDQASEEADLYSVLYEPYYEKLMACNAEINIRSATITELEEKYNELSDRKSEIQKELNFKDYLGEELYTIFCAYRREDKYTNENYISDGLDNAEIFDNARKFIDVAKKELYKAAMPKHSISTTLYNLLIMPEFKVIIDKFELGNWIRVCVDEDIYRLRLISYEINFSNIQTLNVEFSDVTRQIGCVSDIKSILESAQNMATNYSYISKQAEKGNEANDALTNVVENGLNSALIQINNNTHEEVTYGKHGILCKEYDDMIDDYSPEQLKITHNVLVFSEDNWKTSALGLGKHNYTYFDGSKFVGGIGYGLSAKFLQAPYMYGGQIISGDIYSTNYSPTDGKGCHIDLNNGSFTLADSKIVYDADTSQLTLKGINIDWSTSSTPEVSDIDGLGSALNNRPTTEQMNAAISLSEESLLSTVSKSYATQEQIDNLQQQIDGAIETFTGSEIPTLENEPAVNWTTDELKDSHVGDLYIVSSENEEYSGFYYRFEKNNGTYQWVVLQDNEIAKALEEVRKANEAVQALADELAANYSTTVDMNSAIEQSATSIKLTVDEQITETKTYADTVASTAQANAISSSNSSTDEKLKSYSTTEEMNSAISVSAQNINLSVDSKITETKTYADNTANTAQANAISSAVTSANASTDEKLKSYSTTTQMNSAIKLATDNIALEVSKTYETKSNAESQYESLFAAINVNSNAINLKVSQGEVVSEINQSSEQITLSGNRIVIDSTNLKVTSDGTLTATNGYFKGEVHIPSGGSIGGFTIGTSNGNSYLYKGTSSLSSTSSGIYVGTNGIRNYVSDTAYVNITNGIITAKGADITGTITATGGVIGGCAISDGVLKVASANITSLDASKITSGTISASRIDGSRLTIKSGSTIAGWSIDSNSIYSGTTWGSDVVFMCRGTNSSYTIGGYKTSGWVFGAGSTFGVTKGGALYCTSGQIGGWTINSDKLYVTETGGMVAISKAGVAGRYRNRSGSLVGITALWESILTAAVKCASIPWDYIDNVIN